tara:strand:+ start:1698 stop:2657 length:960 start_codon:yes stop_codon:yes gene_type:complete
MNRKKILFNSFMSSITVFICLIIFIQNSKNSFNIYDLSIYIYNGYHYLITASFLLIISVYIRAFRWQYLFQSNTNPTIKHLFSAQLVGYFINNITPIRIGDFAKSYLIAKKTNTKTSYILGSIIMERLLDTMMLCIFLLILIWHYGISYLNINFNASFFLFFLFIPLALFIIIYNNNNLISIKIKNILFEVWNGFTDINLSSKGIIIFSSILIWLIYWCNVFLIQLIFPLFELTLMDCLFILVTSSLIQMIPTGFGALGIFHLGVESVLSQLGAMNHHNFLILLWLYSYIVYTSFGAYYFIQEGKVTLKNLYLFFLKNH